MFTATGYLYSCFLGETMSTAIMQAMACGKPIIASDVPGIDNMIEHDITGILVPAKNAVALAKQ
ncbi:MAG: glycosyltransferase [Chitinophagaceae bacterium]|nr:glycosyltransferase [Chitinophagaceae bacterium]